MIWKIQKFRCLCYNVAEPDPQESPYSLAILVSPEKLCSYYLQVEPQYRKMLTREHFQNKMCQSIRKFFGTFCLLTVTGTGTYFSHLFFWAWANTGAEAGAGAAKIKKTRATAGAAKTGGSDNLVVRSQKISQILYLFLRWSCLCC